MFEFFKNLFTNNNDQSTPLLENYSGYVGLMEGESQDAFNLFFFDPDKVLEEGYEFAIQLTSEEACHEYAAWVEKDHYRIEKFDKANSKIVFET